MAEARKISKEDQQLKDAIQKKARQERRRAAQGAREAALAMPWSSKYRTVEVACDLRGHFLCL